MAGHPWHIAVTTAEATQDEVAEIFSSRGIEIIENHKNGYFWQYDLKVRFPNNLERTFEVKEDFMCRKTGNVALEFEEGGRQIGINHTEADYFIYKIHNTDSSADYYATKTPTIKEMIAGKDYTRIITNAGYENRTSCYLFTKSTWVSNSIIVYTTAMRKVA